MDKDIRDELDELSLAYLRQEARIAALQIVLAELLRLEGEQIEAFVERYAIHHALQLKALAERIRVRHPHLADRLKISS